MGVYAGALAPRDSAVVSGTVLAYHSYSSDGADNPYGDDYQQAAQEQYRLVGAGSWTTTAVISGSSNAISLGALANGNYERQVRVQSAYSGAWSAWSASAFFTVASPPSAPTLSAPAAGATITTPTTTVSWSAPASIEGYEVQVRTASGGGGAIEWTSGQVYTNTGTMTATLPTAGGVTRYVRVRVRNNGLWGAWAERNIVVSWVPPATPTGLTATPSDEAGIGSTHTLLVTMTHPTPSGGQPTVTRTDVYARAVGDTGSGILVATSASAAASLRWRDPAAIQYQVKARVTSADGRYAETGWVTATAANVIKGFVLLDPNADTTTVRGYRYNDEGAEDSWEIESALIEYQGREFPAVEFGDSSSREISVGLIHSKGSGDAAALITLLKRRSIVLYRDSKGRKAYGLLQLGGTQDTYYGFTTSLKITAVDYPSDTDVR